MLNTQHEHMTILSIPISKLTLPSDNPRKITKDQFAKLCNSIKQDPEFLSKRPVLVNLIDGVYSVYAGSQRVRAAKKLGMKSVPCIVDQDLDTATVKRRSIQDNVHHGEFDWDLLSALCDPAELLELGMTENDLKLDMPDKEDTTLMESEQEANSTIVGDVFHLNDHIIACVDSSDTSFFDNSLRNETPVLLMTNPEYADEIIHRWKDFMESSGKIFWIKKNGEIL